MNSPALFMATCESKAQECVARGQLGSDRDSSSDDEIVVADVDLASLPLAVTP